MNPCFPPPFMSHFSHSTAAFPLHYGIKMRRSNSEPDVCDNVLDMHAGRQREGREWNRDDVRDWLECAERTHHTHLLELSSIS